MKAQRRHDLQENELAKAIKKAPNFWQESGGKFLALCVALVVIVVLIRYRISSNREAAQQAVQNLSSARGAIAELNGMRRVISFAPADLISQQQRQLYNDANNLISNALGISDDRKIQAEALVAKGDLHYTLATTPPVEGAATQPILVIKEPKELLETASEAYRTVINNYADQKYAAIAARFGLAAIAENRGDWDAAKGHYDQIVLDTKDMQAYQQMASIRLNMLTQLREPLIMGTPASMPSIAEMTTPTPTLGAVGPLAPATLRASTQAAAAATGPAVATPQAAIALPNAPTTASTAPSTQSR